MINQVACMLGFLAAAWAGPPQTVLPVPLSNCFISGKVAAKDPSYPMERGMSNVIRRDFQIENSQDCLQTLQTYCQIIILDRHLAPVGLKGRFKRPAGISESSRKKSDHQKGVSAPDEKGGMYFQFDSVCGVVGSSHSFK